MAAARIAAMSTALLFSTTRIRSQRFRRDFGGHSMISTVSPMPGRVVAVLVSSGDEVVAGQALLTIEAMKMEHQVVSPHAGVVGEVYVQPGQQLDGGQALLDVDPS